MLSEFTQGATPMIRESPAESARFNCNIGRLVVPFSTSATDREVVSLCDESQFDLLIVRAAASRHLLASALSLIPKKRVFLADCLLYFSQLLLVKNNSTTDVDSSLSEIVPSELAELLDLVRVTFQNYQNHYAANPRLSAQASIDGYVEWIAQLHHNQSGHIFVAKNEKREVVSFMAIQKEGDAAEILLNGTRPDHQQLGLYPNLLTYASRQLAERGSNSLVTSTQATNIAVINSWIKSGFRYTGAINTFHIEKR
jgi:ribosomal protein S18 acetylase RimI-like enzyme